MEDIFRYEFTVEEVNRLYMGLITAKIDDEQFLVKYPDADPGVKRMCACNIRACEVLMDKLRRDYK